MTGRLAIGIYEFGSVYLRLENSGRKARAATNMLTEAAKENTLDRPSLSPKNPETRGPASIPMEYAA